MGNAKPQIVNQGQKWTGPHPLLRVEDSVCVVIDALAERNVTVVFECDNTPQTLSQRYTDLASMEIHRLTK